MFHWIQSMKMTWFSSLLLLPTALACCYRPRNGWDFHVCMTYTSTKSHYTKCSTSRYSTLASRVSSLTNVLLWNSCKLHGSESSGQTSGYGFPIASTFCRTYASLPPSASSNNLLDTFSSHMLQRLSSVAAWLFDYLTNWSAIIPINANL